MTQSIKKKPYTWLLSGVGAIIAAMVIYFGGALWTARDATLTQKGVDDVQNVRIQHIESTVDDIKDTQKTMNAKLDTILDRL